MSNIPNYGEVELIGYANAGKKRVTTVFDDGSFIVHRTDMRPDNEKTLKSIAKRFLVRSHKERGTKYDHKVYSVQPIHVYEQLLEGPAASKFIVIPDVADINVSGPSFPRPYINGIIYKYVTSTKQSEIIDTEAGYKFIKPSIHKDAMYFVPPDFRTFSMVNKLVGKESIKPLCKLFARNEIRGKSMVDIPFVILHHVTLQYSNSPHYLIVAFENSSILQNQSQFEIVQDVRDSKGINDGTSDIPRMFLIGDKTIGIRNV